ncbi:hypothetical protein ES703_42871 [subsurface metagenome]
MKMDLLRLGVLIAVLGCLLAIVTLVPEKNFTDQITKFWLGTCIFIVAFFGLFGNSIFEHLQEYKKTKNELGYVPRSIKYEKYRREHYIDPKTGAAEVNYCLKVKNIGKDKLKHVAKPVEFEIPRPRKRGRKPLLNVESILIDNNELEDPYECYEKLCEKRREDGKYVEEGCFQIPLDQIGGLKKGETCNVLVKVSSKKAFTSIRNEDFVGATIYHQMEVLELIVSVKGNWAIKQIKKTDTPDSIQVYDNVLRTLRFDEMNNVPKPEIRGNTISWIIKKPKLSYRYILLFRATKKRRK